MSPPPSLSHLTSPHHSTTTMTTTMNIAWLLSLTHRRRRCHYHQQFNIHFSPHLIDEYDTTRSTRLGSTRLDTLFFCSLLLLQSRSLSSFSSRVNWISGGRRRRRRRTESISTFGFCSIRQDSIDQSMKHHHQLVAIDDLIWAPFIRIESALLLLFTEEEERKKEKNRSMENGFFFFFFFIFSFCCCCCRVVRDERR